MPTPLVLVGLLLAAAPPAAEKICPPAPPAADEEQPTTPYNVRESGRNKPKDPKDVCAVADSNLAREEDAVLRAPAPQQPLVLVPWDHKAPPVRLDKIRKRFEVTRPELDAVNRNGFAVLTRLEQPSFTYAYHEIFQSELPVFISMDSIFHAVFASHDGLVAVIEKKRIEPLLQAVLARMHCGLPAAAAEYPPEVARDLDLYLVVAGRLLGDAGSSQLKDAQVEAQAAALIAKAEGAAAMETVDLFGRPRAIDFTQFAPRGHYADENLELAHYFRSAMWLSRLEFNLVSRSSRSSEPGDLPDPSETPREAIAALALADLAQKSGAAADIELLDRAWRVLAGRREDVTLAQLSELRQRAGITSLKSPDAFSKLKAAIGAGFKRTVRIHRMPEGSLELPAIATLLGPRIVPDARAIMPLVHGEVPGRMRVGASDMAFSLGQDSAKKCLKSEIGEFPSLEKKLETARTIVKEGPYGSEDLYSAWLLAIRGLAAPTPGALPSWFGNDAQRDLRQNSIVAAFGQLKHNYVLMAGQTYSECGCKIPDGYVEPAPAALDGLIDYADRGVKAMATLDPRELTGGAQHFQRLGKTLRVLRRIVDDELANRPLSQDEQRFLAMVAEMSQDTSVETTGYPPLYTGWYFDLFFAREEDGMRDANFIADYFTSQDQISYVGAAAPRLAIFVVDTGGTPRAFVGPVARAFEYHTPVSRRLNDQAVNDLKDLRDPWAASYSVASPPPPDVSLSWDAEKRQVIVTSPKALGKVTVKLLDHHHTPVGSRSREVGQGETVFQFNKGRKVGGVAIEIGPFVGWAVAGAYGGIEKSWGALARAKDEAPAP